MDIVRRNTDYALRAMVNLAHNHGNGLVSSRTIAAEEDIPYQLACKLMQKLADAGLVASVMGSKGGYRLRRDASEINLMNVIGAIQGPVRLNRCLLSDKACSQQKNCPVKTKLEKLQQQMDEYFGSVSLKELVSKRASR